MRPSSFALGLLLAAVGCSPIVRDPGFSGARDRVTDVSLLGPFDGQVLDEQTAEPLQGATVVGVWSYDVGDGLIAPLGSEVVEVKTDQAGRYRIPNAPMQLRGATVRLVAFDLVVYKRGYVAYRSDSLFEGGSRSDFTLRHNKVLLRKWREGDSHAQHLLFLAAPDAVEQLSKWEREEANLDLYRAQGGAAVSSAKGPATPATPAERMQLLNALELLPPEEVRRRTGYSEAFTVREFTDLVRTHFYHGVHLQAVDRDETWDLGYRVWKNPPDGLGPVRETLQASLPGVKPTREVTDETYVFDSDTVRAVGFLDAETGIGLLLTCGAEQCADIETAIILAKFAYERIESLELIDAPSDPGSAAPLLPPSAARGRSGDAPASPAAKSDDPAAEPKPAPATGAEGQ